MKGGEAEPALSLKGRALQWLSQREHSRSEMRRKLLTHARAQAALAQARLRTAAELLADARSAPHAIGWTSQSEAITGSEVSGNHAPGNHGNHGNHGNDVNDGGDGDPGHGAATSLQAQVDAVLDWLAANRYLSEERFVESRVHARAARFGNLRIRQELAQHGLDLGAAAAQALKDTELSRARAVWERKFSAGPASATERARQQRFLAGRGFSPEVIHQLLRSLARPFSGERDSADPHD